MKFIDKIHEKLYKEICSRMRYLDCYHYSVAYLIALDKVLRDHIDAVFDFEEDVIKPKCLYMGFQTGTSLKTTRLAFNLWNGFNQDLSSNFTVDNIFCCSYAPYYWQAIQLRYPEYSHC